MADLNTKLLCLAALVLCSSFLLAQCPLALNLKTQQEVDEFILDYPNCKSINGGVILGATPPNEPRSNIHNLTPLSNLIRINGHLILWRLDSLESLDGLDSLKFIGGDLFLRWNSKLRTLNNLNSLDTIGGNLAIQGHNNLISVYGLRNLRYVQDDLDISLNDSLTTLAGLENLEIVNGSLRIQRSPLLTNLLGLENLVKIKGNLRISESSIENFNELNNLKNIMGHVTIQNNLNLKSLVGIESLDNVGGEFNLQRNDSLTDCHSICKLLTQGYIGGVVTIDSNAVGCNSIQSIVVEPCVSITDDKNITSSLIEIFPNPVTSILHLRAKTQNSNSMDIALLNSLGVVVHSEKYQNLNTLVTLQIDITHLKPGMHFVLASNKYYWSTETIIITE